MRTGPDSRRVLFGIAVSLLAHLLLFSLPSGRPPPAPPSKTIELEILLDEPFAELRGAPVDEQRPPGPEASGASRIPAVGEGVASTAPPQGAQEERRTEPRGDLPPAVAPEPGKAPEAPAKEEPVVRREEDGVWREEALPRLDLVYRPKFSAEEEPVEDSEGSADTEGRQVEDRLGAYFRDRRAEERALSRAEPALVELRQRLERRFSVPMEVLDEAPQNFTLDLGGAMRAYLSQARRYAGTGNPYEEDFLAPGAPDAVDTAASAAFRYGRADETFGPPLSSATALLTTLVARIEVVRGEAGMEARLVEGSGVPRFDRLALEQVRREMARMSLLSTVQRTRWAFISSLRVTPPSPMVGCSLDHAFIPQECFYPGSKHQRSRVLLEAIYGD